MSLKKLSEENLIQKAQSLAASERKIYSAMIEVLEEIERRKLYLARGYSSLFEFCTEHLKYSAGAAHRRISSMRLLKDFPASQKKEVRQKLDAGALNLTHLSQVSKLVREKPKAFNASKKVEIVKSLENKSARETEAKMISYGAKPAARRESLRSVSETETRLSVILDEETQALLKMFIALSARKNPWASKEKAIKLALAMAVEKLDPVRKKGSARQTRGKSVSDSEVKAQSKKRTRYIPRQTRRQVWQINQGLGCMYRDPKTDRRCKSHFGLEVDYIQEFSKGGSNDTANLRLLCSAHNRWRSSGASKRQAQL